MPNTLSSVGLFMIALTVLASPVPAASSDASGPCADTPQAGGQGSDGGQGPRGTPTLGVEANGDCVAAVWI